MSAGKLFCRVCREEISLKLSVLESHVQTEKHTRSKQQLSVKEARERDIATSLQDHQKGAHLEGESLPISQQVYRVKVLTAFLHAAVPLAKVDCFRQILEENEGQECVGGFCWNDETWRGYGDSVTFCPGLAAVAKIGQASHAG